MSIGEQHDSEYFLALQTQTGWGRTLAVFAEWCQVGPGWITLDIGCGPGLLPALFQAMGCVSIGADLDLGMYEPRPLHPDLVNADGNKLPFPCACFHQVTTSNLLFLLPDPLPVMGEIARVLKPGGQAVLLNPSENLTVQAALNFVEQRNLLGLARETFLNWAARAEANHRWDEDETRQLFTQVGLIFDESVLRIGQGYARFSRGRSII